MRFLKRAAIVSLVLAIGTGAGLAAEGEAEATGGNPMVVMETNHGKITIELFADKAPTSVANFLQYVDDGFYDGLIFHRVIPDFMIQGGGFDQSMNKKDVRPPIQNEADNGLLNDIGTLAMARTSVVNSATSQFFINTKDNGFLNHRDKSARGYGYAVFGKVTEGLDVVRKIEAVATKRLPNGMADVPVDPVVIVSVARQ